MLKKTFISGLISGMILFTFIYRMFLSPYPIDYGSVFLFIISIMAYMALGLLILIFAVIPLILIFRMVFNPIMTFIMLFTSSIKRAI